MSHARFKVSLMEFTRRTPGNLEKNLSFERIYLSPDLPLENRRSREDLSSDLRRLPVTSFKRSRFLMRSSNKSV